MRKLTKEIRVPFEGLKVCYEARPTGFVLARRLIQLGLESLVMAPAKSTRKSGDLRRFENPRSFMSFLGLVPSEHSSGIKHFPGTITKCGNRIRQSIPSGFSAIRP